MPEQNDSLKDKFIHAYDQMMKHLHDLMNENGKGTENLHQMLDKARDKITESGNVTREEAEKISGYLKRDLHNAGEYLQDSSNDLADWLHMDIELIEWNLQDLFLQVADKTKLDLLLLEENAKHVNEYRTGEITGPGTLVCDKCQEELHFLNTGHVPPCPKCKATQFQRKSR